MGLFQKSVLKEYINNVDKKNIIIKYKKYIEYFKNDERKENIKETNEERYQQIFFQQLFVNILGYTLYPEPQYDLIPEYKNETNSKKADGAVLKDNNVIAVIELKSTKTVDMNSIEDQAFGYKRNHRYCKYVITSNFEKLRLYIGDYSIEYEEFNLFNLDYYDFIHLYLSVSKDSLISDLPIKIKNESKLKEQQITYNLYNDYSILKKNILDNLITNNPLVEKITLLKKSQKLLDRILFILFAEDRGLLPPNIISKIISEYENLKMLDERKSLYSVYCKYFKYIDKGSKRTDFSIAEYNGELFKPDPILDTIIIDDDILNKDIMKISNYDFSDEVDVDILGHIFENSLNDIEELQAELSETRFNKTKTKKKKEGVFYTPKYITHYIVENSLGILCKKKKKELKLDKINLDLTSRQKNNLFRRVNQYKDFLLSLKILDPACGSGAFIIQVLDFLIKEHTFIADHLKILTPHELSDMYEISTTILERNIYGVDLNEEAVEIAKLSLWLRTAEKGRKLNDLSKNIKCGNSLIDNTSIACGKEFNWSTEFPFIITEGGFDIVIGNPPYVPTEHISKEEKIFFEKTYISAYGRINLYPLFYEKGIKLLKEGGFLSYITPYTILKNQYYIESRKFIMRNTSVTTLIDFKGIKVFEDAAVDSVILILQKTKKENNKFTMITNIKDFLANDYLIYNVLQSDIEKNADYSFNIAVDDNLFKNIGGNCNPLSKVIRFKQGIITGNNKEYVTNIAQEKSIKVITGSDFHRYKLYWNGKYITYDTEKLHRPRVKEIFEVEEKIILRQTASFPICMIDHEQFYTLDTVHNGTIVDRQYSAEYLLAILNSKFIRFLYESQINETGKVFAQVKIIYINPLPIKIAKNEDQKPFIDKVQKIINLKSKITSIQSDFLNLIIEKYNIQKISKKLNNWSNYNFNNFIIELKKTGIKLKLQEESELLKFYKTNSEKYHEHEMEILKLEKELDNMVYELYCLTKQQIKIIEA